MTDVAAVLGAEALRLDEAGKPVLVASRCTQCHGLTFPHGVVCSVCGSESVVDEDQPGTGTLYTHTTVHVAAKRWGGPAAFGYIDLPTGLRVFSHLEGTDWQAGETVTLGLAERGIDGARSQAFVFRHGGAV